VIVLDKLLARGIGWVLQRVHDVAYAELHDESSLREELLAAQLRLELGEIGEGEFLELESALLARMREVRAAREGDAEDEARAALQPGARYVVAAIEADAGEEPVPDKPRKTRRPTTARKKKRRQRR
jgi:hypothetical protein